MSTALEAWVAGSIIGRLGRSIPGTDLHIDTRSDMDELERPVLVVRSADGAPRALITIQEVPDDVEESP